MVVGNLNWILCYSHYIFFNYYLDINHTNVNMQVMCSGGMFPHSRDKDGKLIFVIKVRLNVKGIVKPEDIHRALGNDNLTRTV